MDSSGNASYLPPPLPSSLSSSSLPSPPLLSEQPSADRDAFHAGAALFNALTLQWQQKLASLDQEKANLSEQVQELKQLRQSCRQSLSSLRSPKPQRPLSSFPSLAGPASSASSALTNHSSASSPSPSQPEMSQDPSSSASSIAAAAAASAGRSRPLTAAELANQAGQTLVGRLAKAISASDRFPESTKDMLQAPLATDEFATFFKKELLGSFVADTFARFLAGPSSVLPPDQLKTLSKQLEAEVFSEILELFEGAAGYSVHVAENMKYARMLALRVALETTQPVRIVISSSPPPAAAAAPVSSTSSASSLPADADPDPDPAAVAADLALSSSSSTHPTEPSGALPAAIAASSSSSSSLSFSPPPALPPPALSRPVFYTTQGFTLSAHGENFVFMNNGIIRLIPLHKLHSSPNSVSGFEMDHELLADSIVADRAHGLTPCAILATVGSTHGYQVDDLWALRKICTQHGLWLHVEGTSLFMASARSTPPFAMALFQCADSACDAPLQWFDTSIVDSPAVCFLKPDHSVALPPSQLRADTSLSAFQALFRLWNRLKSEPAQFLSRYVELGLVTCSRFRQLLSSAGPLVEVLSPPKENHPDIVFFRVMPTFALNAFNLDLNSFNTWLSVHLREDLRRASMSEYMYEGKAGFLFHPLFPRDSARMLVQIGVVEGVVQSLITEASYVPAALNHRAAFQQFVEQHPHLVYVPRERVHGFVGVGAFRFLPEILATDSASERVAYTAELNLVEHALVKQLRSMDADLYDASVADVVSADGTSTTATAVTEVCVVVRTSAGALSDRFVTDVAKHITEAVNSVEMPRKVVDRMSEIVQQVFLFLLFLSCLCCCCCCCCFCVCVQVQLSFPEK